MPSHKKRLGELLLEKGILSPEQLEYALRFQQRGNKFLGQILISIGLTTEFEVYKALSELLHVDFVNLEHATVHKHVTELVPKLLVVTRDILPLYVEDNYLYLVMENPRDFDVIQIVEFSTHRQVKPLIATPSQLQRTIHRVYGIKVGSNIKPARPDELEQLGLSATHLDQYQCLLQHSHGVIIVTEPSSPENGKMATMYATLKALNQNPVKNIVTIEDPVEYELPGIKQIQVNEESGLSFHSILSLLSGHDPNIQRDYNVILIGELRDAETARILMRLSETGHLILSTLQTEDTVAAIHHLSRLGDVSKFVASNLLGVLAQRLVRELCAECKQLYQPNERELLSLGIQKTDETPFVCYQRQGCPTCNYTGYSGYVGLYEILVMNDRLRHEIAKCPPKHQLRRLTSNIGIKTLLEDGIEKIRQGITSIDEVIQACCEKCRGCGRAVVGTEQVCPFCGFHLYDSCEACGAKLDVEWMMCPFCGVRKPKALPSASAKNA
ncbi:type IV pilus assembly protein PilB [Candidatus Vecturithrix granuli]|uniref:Type IV pilus assembly protein PilB n=1 Tax=Vecturithrix granuli TaxID=1499967 RepID=A0A081C3M6_VECG1|nr:type IV pilus assembly protein PilB [Candidatus Vecturithrix granuli]